MGIIVNKDQDENNQLTERITADLREKMSSTSNFISDDMDPAKDSDYVKDLKKTSSHAWIWTILIILALISLVLIAII